MLTEELCHAQLSLTAELLGILSIDECANEQMQLEAIRSAQVLLQEHPDICQNLAGQLGTLMLQSGVGLASL